MKLETLGRHTYNAKCQHKKLNHLYQNIGEQIIILQENFAENYAIKQQNEVMAAHWAPDQVTVFTAVVYYRQNFDHCLSHVVVSNELEHNKPSVYIFNKFLMTPRLIGKKTYSTSTTGQMDVEAGLKSTPCQTCSINKNLDAKLTGTFETAHGKGPLDGIGDIVKYSVWLSTMQGSVPLMLKLSTTCSHVTKRSLCGYFMSTRKK